MVKIRRKKDPQLVLAGPLQPLPIDDGFVYAMLTVSGVPPGRYTHEVSQEPSATEKYGIPFGRDVISLYDASQLRDAGVIDQLEAFGFTEVGGEMVERKRRERRDARERLEESVRYPPVREPVRLIGGAGDYDLAERVLKRHGVPGYLGSASIVTRDTGYPANTTVDLYPSRGERVAAAERALRGLGFYDPTPSRSRP